jgi:acetolactate synthase-1/3 small subunit
MESRILALLVSNHFGVLTRVTNLFSRRGFNIKALTVGETDNPELSRITILTEGDESTLEQITKQLVKLEDVKKVVPLPAGGCVGQELLLIKISGKNETYVPIERAIAASRAKILNYEDDAMIITVTDDTKGVDRFIDEMRPYGIMEICRTGVAALGTGSKTINE